MKMIEFTPQYAVERGINPKELRFYLDDKLVDNRVIVGAYMPEAKDKEAEGWIKRLDFIPDINGNVQFDDNEFPICVPDNPADAALNELDENVDMPFKPNYLKVMGQVKWNIVKDVIEKEEKPVLSDVKEE